MARGKGGLFSEIHTNTLLQMVLYNLIGELINSVIQPYLFEVTAEVNRATPLAPLSPQEAALAVIRGLLSTAEGAHEAAAGGIDAARFDTLTGLTGQVPAPMDAAAALRRGLIDRSEYDRIIRYSDLRPEYGDLMRKLAVGEPSPTDVLGALLQGQVSHGFAVKRYAELGGNPDDFQWLFDSNGQAPTPSQALELLNRGIIPERGTGPDSTSYEQAFLEGPWRNKWLEPFLALREYLPPPRTITAMYKQGALTHDRAAELLTKQGLAPDTVGYYLSEASAVKTADDRKLALGMVRTLYADRIVTADAATSMLADLGYSAEEAGFILAVQDAQLGQRFLSAAIGRIHTLYVGHKVDLDGATTALRGLGLEEQAITDVIAIWDWERAANVKPLTVTEIVGAVKLSLMDTAAAQAELVGLGYTPYDAWLVLSVHMKAAQGTAPAGSA